MMLTMPDCLRGCVKGLFLVLNGVCILVSLSVIGFAIVDLRLLQQYGTDIAGRVGADGSLVGDMFVMVAGLLLLAAAVCGCVGAVRENVRILYLYAGFLMILVILEFLVGVFVAVQRYGLQFLFTDWIREDFYKNVTGEELRDHSKLWDDLQSTYECCGLNGPEDYEALGLPVSMSCCPRAYTARTQQAQMLLLRACIKSEGYYSNGCEDEILSALQAGGDCLLGIAVISFWVEAAGTLLAMWMANNIRNEVKIYKETVRY